MKTTLNGSRHFVMPKRCRSADYLNFSNLFWCYLCCYKNAVWFECHMSCHCDSCFAKTFQSWNFICLISDTFWTYMNVSIYYNHIIPPSKEFNIQKNLRNRRSRDPLNFPGTHSTHHLWVPVININITGVCTVVRRQHNITVLLHSKQLELDCWKKYFLNINWRWSPNCFLRDKA